MFTKSLIEVFNRRRNLQIFKPDVYEIFDPGQGVSKMKSWALSPRLWRCAVESPMVVVEVTVSGADLSCVYPLCCCSTIWFDSHPSLKSVASFDVILLSQIASS